MSKVTFALNLFDEKLQVSVIRSVRADVPDVRAKYIYFFSYFDTMSFFKFVVKFVTLM